MLNATCRETEQRQDNGRCHDAVATAAAPPVVLQDPDKSLRLQACWIRLWDRWACEQRNLVLYQMHINHALSRERSKLALAGGRVVSCRRVKHHHHLQQQQQQQHHHHQHHQQSGAVTAVAAAMTTTGAGVRCRSPTQLHHAGGRSCPSYPEASPEPVAGGGGPAELHLMCGPNAVGARDIRVLSTAVDRLRASGWYYEGPDARDRAAAALSAMPAGRFCVRDSRHSGHLFTMDVQTGGGRRGDDGRLMSVRFTYADGLFGLESMPRRAGALRVPKFRCPIELIDYYVRLSRIEAARQVLVYPVWIDRCGQFFSWMNLRRPMVKADAAAFPSLKHTCRLVINRHKRLITITPTSLPNELIEYLLQYPYSL